MNIRNQIAKIVEWHNVKTTQRKIKDVVSGCNATELETYN